jgi:maleylacetate reductase
MTDPLAYDALPMRVVFGSGSLVRVADEAQGLGLKRALVLSTPEQRSLADQVAALLAGGPRGGHLRPKRACTCP